MNRVLRSIAQRKIFFTEFYVYNLYLSVECSIHKSPKHKLEALGLYIYLFIYIRIISEV